MLARSTETLWINGTVNTRVSGSGEAPGFWKNWDSHNTYSEEEIEVWLASINGTSDWLGPTTVEDMVAAF